MRAFTVLVGLIGLSLVLAACGGGGGGETGGAATGGAAVEMSEFAFKPSSLSGSTGAELVVELKNAGTVAHNFVIDELSVNSGLVDGGKSKSYRFTPSQAGSFTFYCNVPAHREAGMTGTITVS